LFDAADVEVPLFHVTAMSVLLASDAVEPENVVDSRS